MWYTLIGGATIMNNRKYNTDPELLLKQGKAIMSSSDESRFHFRVFAVNMVLSGFPASEIGAMAGVSKVAVTGWVKTADEQGFDALRPKGHKGAMPKLTDEQCKVIDAALQSDPKEYGYKNWDGPSLAAYIESKFGVTLSVRQCQRLFHKLGYSHIRPQPYPSKGYEDTDERNEFKKNETN
jgi:transposase